MPSISSIEISFAYRTTPSIKEQITAEIFETSALKAAPACSMLNVQSPAPVGVPSSVVKYSVVSSSKIGG